MIPKHQTIAKHQVPSSSSNASLTGLGFFFAFLGVLDAVAWTSLGAPSSSPTTFASLVAVVSTFEVASAPSGAALEFSVAAPALVSFSYSSLPSLAARWLARAGRNLQSRLLQHAVFAEMAEETCRSSGLWP
ncbi:unnamed protein product [Zymoseptoria tritici ST99CH_3D7]|uniref:Uncharacterized protein n=1 Tax=Zymoseptoria tritici (strain ST99CH_3D7) TaxID=1276538 RepID=A0A1X7RLB6_ZYMT9|nr:unnamed protein product [Zymoseptoria tritici ST99CH_3D7]